MDSMRALAVSKLSDSGSERFGEENRSWCLEDTGRLLTPGPGDSALRANFGKGGIGGAVFAQREANTLQEVPVPRG